MSDQTIKEVLANPSTQAKLVEMLVNPKPHGWGKKSNSPYYRERYAKDLKEALDRMIAGGHADVVYRYTNFPGMSPNSLYLMVNMAQRYLTTFLDPDGTYETLLRQCATTRERGVGVRISAAHLRARIEGNDKPELVVPRKDEPVWKEKMENWIEEGVPGTQFYQGGLALSTEEVEEIKSTIAGLPSIMASITHVSIKLIYRAV